MSIRVMARVWEHSEQSGSALLVLLAMADFADEDGVAYPTQQTLARKARITDRQVRTLLRQLEGAGEVEVLRGYRGRRAKHYRVVGLAKGTPPNPEADFQVGEAGEAPTRKPASGLNPEVCDTQPGSLASSKGPQSGSLSGVAARDPSLDPSEENPSSLRSEGADRTAHAALVDGAVEVDDPKVKNRRGFLPESLARSGSCYILDPEAMDRGDIRRSLKGLKDLRQAEPDQVTCSHVAELVALRLCAAGSRITLDYPRHCGQVNHLAELSGGDQSAVVAVFDTYAGRWWEPTKWPVKAGSVDACLARNGFDALVNAARRQGAMRPDRGEDAWPGMLSPLELDVQERQKAGDTCPEAEILRELLEEREDQVCPVPPTPTERGAACPSEQHEDGVAAARRYLRERQAAGDTRSVGEIMRDRPAVADGGHPAGGVAHD